MEKVVCRLGIVFCLGTVLEFAVTFKDPTYKQVGVSYSEIAAEVKECEKDLPRSLKCKVNISITPEEK